VKNFRAHSVSRASASCSKILNGKKYIQYSEKFQGKLCFQGKCKLLKNSECKKYIQYSEKFQGTLFSGQAQSCSKFLNGKKYIQYSEKFQGKRKVAQKFLNGKKYIQYSEKFQGELCLQGKHKLLKSRERWKNFQHSVYSLGGDLRNLG